MGQYIDSIVQRLSKISWTEHKTNEEVLKAVDEERMLVSTIRRRQKNWIGHVLRRDSLLRTVLEGRMKGKKVPGRPRTMMLDWMKNKDRGFKDVKEKVKNRD